MTKHSHKRGKQVKERRRIPPKIILLVDDSQLIRTLYAEVLEEAGYHVIQTPDAFAAIEQAKERPDVDLLITDYQMPGMNGLELAQWFASSRPAVKLLLVSASPEHIDHAVRAMPGLECMIKTATVAEFLARVAALLEPDAAKPGQG